MIDPEAIHYLNDVEHCLAKCQQNKNFVDAFVIQSLLQNMLQQLETNRLIQQFNR